MHAGSGNGSGVLINLAINWEGSCSSLYNRISLKSWLLRYEGTIQNLMLPCLENEVNSVDDRGVDSWLFIF